MLRRPQLRVFDPDGRFAVCEAADAAAMEMQVADAVIFGLHGDAHAAVRGVGGDPQGGDIALRHPLRPDRLPDAALRRVPDAAALRFLLAARQLVRIRPVADGNQKHIAFRKRIRRVQRERGVAAGVTAEQPPVQPDPALLIDCAEMEQQPHSGLRRFHKHPAVPEILAGKQRPADAGKLRLRRKRNKNFSVPVLRTCVGIRDGIVPETVQIAIAFAHHLRARVFLQDCVWIKLFAPDCFHTRASRAAARFFRSSTNGMMNSSTTAAARKISGVGTVLVTPSST